MTESATTATQVLSMKISNLLSKLKIALIFVLVILTCLLCSCGKKKSSKKSKKTKSDNSSAIAELIKKGDAIDGGVDEEDIPTIDFDEEIDENSSTVSESANAGVDSDAPELDNSSDDDEEFYSMEGWEPLT